MKVKLRAHYCRVKVYSKDENDNFEPAGERWLKVRSNSAIPDTHKMFK